MERDGYETDKVRLMMADVLYEEESDGQTANPAVEHIRLTDLYEAVDGYLAILHAILD